MTQAGVTQNTSTGLSVVGVTGLGSGEHVGDTTAQWLPRTRGTRGWSAVDCSSTWRVWTSSSGRGGDSEASEEKQDKVRRGGGHKGTALVQICGTENSQRS